MVFLNGTVDESFFFKIDVLFEEWSVIELFLSNYFLKYWF